jgi:transposase
MVTKRLDETVRRRVRAGRMLLAGKKAHRSKLVREYLDSTSGDIQMAFLPPYSPDLNPVEYLWAWLKRHALANFCPANLSELNTTARAKLKSVQRRPSIIAACWVQAELW